MTIYFLMSPDVPPRGSQEMRLLRPRAAACQQKLTARGEGGAPSGYLIFWIVTEMSGESPAVRL
jgi:hypothetical protein